MPGNLFELFYWLLLTILFPFFLARLTGADDVSSTHGLHAVTAYIVMIVLIWAAQCWGCLAEQEAYLLQ